MKKSVGENAEQVYQRILKENKGDKTTTKKQVEETLERAKNEPNQWGRFMMSNFWNRVRSFAK